MTLRSPAILDELVTRDHLPFFATHYKYRTIVEIGTYRGEYAEHILKNWDGHLYCVDPWADLSVDEYRDGSFTLNGITPEQAYEETLARLDQWIKAGRCTIMRMTSMAAAKEFTAESIDAVYCDGNHAFPVVAAEFATYWPLISSGGLLGTHDTYVRNTPEQLCGVADAVWDFAERLRVRPRMCPCTSSFFLKP